MERVGRCRLLVIGGRVVQRQLFERGAQGIGVVPRQVAVFTHGGRLAVTAYEGAEIGRAHV